MKGGIVSTTGKTAKQIAQDIAKQIVREPIEIIKNATETIVSPSVFSDEAPRVESQPKSPDSKKQEESKKKGLRTVEALNQEIKDIQRNELIEEIQKKINLGEIIYFEKYPELPPEQIEILKQQQEQVLERKRQEAQMGGGGLPETSSKKGRRFSFSRKKAAERESTRTEKPIPSSG